MDSRLPPRLEVSALIRQVQAAGGFATVLQRGEPDAGTLLLILVENGANARVYERMPQLDGTPKWTCAKQQNAENAREIDDYVARRCSQDSDLWVLELDVAQAEHFIR